MKMNQTMHASERGCNNHHIITLAFPVVVRPRPQKHLGSLFASLSFSRSPGFCFARTSDNLSFSFVKLLIPFNHSKSFQQFSLLATKSPRGHGQSFTHRSNHFLIVSRLSLSYHVLSALGAYSSLTHLSLTNAGFLIPARNNVTMSMSLSRNTIVCLFFGLEAPCSVSVNR